MSEPKLTPFPSPWGAFALTVASWFAVATFIVMMVDPEEGAKGEITIGIIGIAQALGIGLVATLGARAVPQPQADRLGLRGFDTSFLVAIALLIPLSFVIKEFTNIAHLMFPPPDLGEVVQRATERLDTGTPLAAIETALVVVGIAPVVEEWLYRGVIQQGLVGHMGRFPGVLMTAGLFGVAHLEPSLSPASAFATFVATLPLGMLLGATRLATGSLLAPILLHAGYNALSLAGMAFSSQFPIPGYNVPGNHVSLVVLAPALLAAGIGTWLVVRDARQAEIMIPIPPPEEEEEDDEAGWFG